MRNLALALTLAAAPAAAQEDLAKVEIKSEALGGSVHMLTGSGGNIGVSEGADGVFVIDDQFAPLTDKILAAIAKISNQVVRFVINTHYHFDHTGGNENLGKRGAVIIAHDNARKRLTTEQFIAAFDKRMPPSPKGALPVITFAESVTFHFNGDTIEAFHVPNAHTDGDTIIRFRNANVIHMGDAFFNGFYPFIDTGAGGSVDGMIAAGERVVGLCDEKTRLIPGHGPGARREDLLAYLRMLRSARVLVERELKAGKTREATIAAQPLKELDAEWGDGFLTPAQFTGIVYDSLKK